MPIYSEKRKRAPVCAVIILAKSRASPYLCISNLHIKQMRTAKKKTTPKITRISNIVKPAGMTPVQWQTLLRKYAAEKETFGILEVDPVHAPGEYQVINSTSRSQYRVIYYGLEHELNCCSCMDFKTSRIGTCKHIEAVKSWIDEKTSRHICRPDPSGTTLYMDYTQEPCVKIRYGREDRQKLKRIFDPLMPGGSFNYLTELRLGDAIREAFQASPFFTCRQDVLDYAARLTDDHARRQRLSDIFKHRLWWKEIFVKGIKPYVYQREGMEFAALAGRCILADEMGLGKTMQAIGTAALLYREGYISSVLVVCPTSLKYQWKREIKTFIGQDALVIEGAQHIRKELYASDDLFKIVSYNSLNNDIKATGGMSVDMVIMDEVQRLKNWDTQIARSARKIHSDYAVILSGTPLENKLEELYSITQLVNQYILGPYYTFRSEHIQTTESGKVIGYKGLNEVGALLKPILLRRRKADVSIQLPERVDQNLFVPMTQEQRDIHEDYKEVAARIVSKWQRMHFLSETDRRRLLTALSMMRMVCDSTYILDQKTRYDTKIEETMNLLDSILSSGNDKVVIFSGWERMTRLIAAELDKAGIGYSNLNGSVPSEKRKDLIDRFTDDPSVRVFLSTDAGSTGLNLQVASYVINLDLPWNPAVLEQRIGRIHRMGQKRNIQVINLIAIGTIEEQMLTKLKFKTDLFDGVLNGGEDEVFLQDSKLETLVKDLGFMQEEEKDTPAEPERPQPADIAEGDTEKKVTAIPPEPEAADVEDVATAPAADAAGSSPQELIGLGVSFLGDLVKTLKDPQATQQLVDTLVHEDSASGKATINIPVSSKESVLQFVKVLGALLK